MGQHSAVCVIGHFVLANVTGVAYGTPRGRGLPLDEITPVTDWGPQMGNHDKIPSVYSAITLSECTVSQIPAEQFFYWATHDIRTLRHFLKSMSLDSTSQTRLHAEIQSNNAAERLEHFMQERTAADPHWQTMDPLPLLKQGELAQLLSVTPEHLSRLRQQQRRHRAFSRAS